MDAAAHLASALADRYNVVREIGRGGMATVYLARDFRHDRAVALKVLDPELGAVLGIERFLAEIRVTANLQHPNLLPLFDSGEAGGLLFYVMPFVEGESLRARLDREKQLPVPEALRIAIAIAGALDYAHRHGVIHRDLKPENVMLHEGQPLVADFGIALAVSNAGGARVTQTGLSLGTPQYMSPEQATGDRAIDGRTDIYSLGALLYEMLTGEPPHSGTTAQAIIARVLTDRPRPMRTSRAAVPEHVEWAVECALEKLPADRFATAHEFAAALEGGMQPTRSGAITGSSPATRSRVGSRRVLLLAGTGALAAAVAGAVAGRSFGATPHDLEPIAFTIEPPSVAGLTGVFQDVSISPDGQAVAFVAAGDTLAQVFLRHLSDPAPQALPVSGPVKEVVFSPDGKSLAFFAGDGNVRKIDVDGSHPVALASAPTYYSGVAWAAGQQLVTGFQGDGTNLMQGTAGVGALKALTTGAKHPFARPMLVDDGKAVLYIEWGPGFTEDDYLGIADRATGASTTSKVLATDALGVVDGHAIIVTADGALRAVPVDLRARRVTGDAIQIEEPGTVSPGTSHARFASNGTLVYLRGGVESRIVLSDSQQGQPISDKRRFTSLRLSPDGRSIAVAVLSQRADTSLSDIFLFDVATRALKRFTSRGDAEQPNWAPDGKSVVFSTWYSGKPSVWRQPVDGSPAERLLEMPSSVGQIGGSTPTPDGRGVVFSWLAGDATASELYYLPAGGDGKPRKLSTGWKVSGQPALSPDGRWLAFTGSESKSAYPEILVMPLDGASPPVQVTSGGASGPSWSRDGSRLYYVRGAGLAMATLRPNGQRMEVVTRGLPVFPNLQQNGDFDVTSDGKHIVTLTRDRADARLVVVTRWTDRVRRRIAEAHSR